MKTALSLLGLLGLAGVIAGYVLEHRRAARQRAAALTHLQLIREGR